MGEARPVGRPAAGPVVTAAPSLVLWEALAQVYVDLGFDATTTAAPAIPPEAAELLATLNTVGH